MGVTLWVAIAIGNAEAARTIEDLAQLRTAMMSRACIGQAKGILMERHKIKEEKAFTILIPPPNEPTPSSATWPPSSSGPAAAQSRLTRCTSSKIRPLRHRCSLRPKTAADAARELVWCEAAIGGDHDLERFRVP